MTVVRHGLLVAALLLGTLDTLTAERIGYSPEEFSARLSRLAEQLESGTIVLFGATAPAAGARFRQDNDFFYVTGNESQNAVLVMDAGSAAAHLFLPQQSDADVRYEGANWLRDPNAAARFGLASIQPLSALEVFLLARQTEPAISRLWLRLGTSDTINHGRIDMAIAEAERRTNGLARYPTEDEALADAVRAEFPDAVVEDITPAIDALRLRKTAQEIEILRYNGRVSAQAMARAIARSAPGRFEYELEAEATAWMLQQGLQSPAYPAIVASGPNGNQWHYEDNGRQMARGELVVMDFGGSLDYLTVDITRTWPVDGEFTDEQRRAYDCVLATQIAVIDAIAPGVSRDTIRTIAEDVFRQHGFDPTYAYVGHYVGLSVHDGGDWERPFEEGMVLAIEPILDMPELGLHIRIEDTVLVTATGAEILTREVPKAIDALLPLVASAP